jgi:hypothetical protein
MFVNFDYELSFFSGGKRRSSYTPSEIKDLIWYIQGVDFDGNDYN